MQIPKVPSLDRQRFKFINVKSAAVTGKIHWNLYALFITLHAYNNNVIKKKLKLIFKGL